jgi:hypothetical protein
VVRKLVRTDAQCAIRDLVSVEDHRHPIRRTLDLLLEPPVQTRVDGILNRRIVPPR